MSLFSEDCSVSSITKKLLGEDKPNYWPNTTCPHFVGDVGSEGREEVESRSVEDEESWGRDQEYQPEPEEQVELLVDDVVREHTDPLLDLFSTSSAEHFKGAHSQDGQSCRQGIVSLQRILS